MQEELPGTSMELQPLSQDLKKRILPVAENGSKSQLLIWNGLGTAQKTGICLKAVLERTGCGLWNGPLIRNGLRAISLSRKHQMPARRPVCPSLVPAAGQSFFEVFSLKSHQDFITDAETQTGNVLIQTFIIVE
jgi:hypothetical protein